MINNLLPLAIKASLHAGESIMKIYDDPTSDFQIESKSDNSPLTIADKTAHQVIVSFLDKTNIPILSEEGKHDSFLKRKDWNKLWIVDPLDGTKEFIKRNGEFTVNIALVEGGSPILGVVYIPSQKRLYFSESSIGAFRLDAIGVTSADLSVEELISQANKLPITRKETSNYIVVASRSHLSKETTDYITKLERKHGQLDFISAGSSIKICWVADGTADIYPRFAPTMEWDTAAGHAIALAAGKNIYLTTDETTPLKYNKENLQNPWFVVK